MRAESGKVTPLQCMQGGLQRSTLQSHPAAFTSHHDILQPDGAQLGKRFYCLTQTARASQALHCCAQPVGPH